MNMIYQRIVSKDDSDIPYLTSVLRLPEISRYISIDEGHYWDYVSETENVFYFKVYDGEDLTAAVHCELSGTTLYMSIMVVPHRQRCGIGSTILADILGGRLPMRFDTVEVSVDEHNTASVRLFEKMGFTRVSQEDELINYSFGIENNLHPVL